jgi:hypothetical protein
MVLLSAYVAEEVLGIGEDSTRSLGFRFKAGIHLLVLALFDEIRLDAPAHHGRGL